MRGIAPFLSLLFFGIFLAAEGSWETSEDDKCVAVPQAQPHPGRSSKRFGRRYRNSYFPLPKAKVATCEFGEELQGSIQEVEEDLSALSKEVANKSDELHEKIKDLREDVDDLQRKDAYLTRISATIFPDFSGIPTRPFCEIYNMAEAQEICRLLGYFNPKVHFVHVNCEKDGNRDECHKVFWKIRKCCFRPNDPRLRGDSPIFECFYDPLPARETCDNLLWISCNGYSDHFLFRDWGSINGTGTCTDC